MMVKANRPGSHTTGNSNTSANANEKEEPKAGNPPSTPNPSSLKGKQSNRTRKPALGGTAVQGAKSTQPKELSTGSPANQQPEYYNREMRRRMQHMGTGPYSERVAVDPRERRRKRQERLKERQERIHHTVTAKGPSRDIRLGRRNTYFLIGIFLVVVVVIVLFIIFRHPF